MKRLLVTLPLCLMSFLAISAQNKVKGDYGYLYCHMSDKGQWTAYAVSKDAENWEDIIGGDSIFSSRELAKIDEMIESLKRNPEGPEV